MRRGTAQEAATRLGRRRWPVVVAALVGAALGVTGTWVAW
jgi:hypothetical protein